MPEQLVASCMAVDVVDHLESVEVETKHRKLPTAHVSSVDCFLEAGKEQRAVGDAGQRVMEGEVTDTRLGGLAGPDVRHGKDSMGFSAPGYGTCRKCNKPDAEFATRLEHCDLGVSNAWTIFGLDSCNRVRRMRASDLLGRHFRQTYSADLACCACSRERAYRILNRYRAIGSMKIIEVDMIGPKAIERAVECREDRLGPCIDDTLAVDDIEGALARKRKFRATVHHRLAKQPFIRALTIDCGRIKEADANIECVIQ